MMETPRAIFHAIEIAESGSRLACLVMGTNDLVKELRAQHTPGREALITSLNLTVIAARAAGSAVIDGVFNDIARRIGLRGRLPPGQGVGL